MKSKLYIILTTASLMITLPAYAGDQVWFWEKAFWMDRNGATPLDRKFYDDSLRFEFCNKGSKKVTIAIGYWKLFADKGNFFITEGWWNVEPAECKVPFQSGGLLSTSLYLHIQVDAQPVTDANFKTSNGDTGGIKGCVESGAFLLFTHESKWEKACKSDDQAVPFLELKNANKHNEYTFTYE